MPNSVSGIGLNHVAAMLPTGGLRCLLLGIRGTGMTALADILRDCGHSVIGADRGLSSADIAIAQSAADETLVRWDESALPYQDIDVCIHTPAVDADDPLIRSLMRGDVPCLSLHDGLAAVLSNRQQICVAGTHGKTTTSAMLAWILQSCGQQPSWFVGGELRNTKSSGAMGVGDCAVIESCEFSTAFQNLSPSVAVLTGIERDHFDRFSSAAEEDESFHRFLNRVPDSSDVVVNVDSERSNVLAKEFLTDATTVSLSSKALSDRATTADWTATDIRVGANVTTFQIHGVDGSKKVSLNQPGRHNVSNAVTAIATAVRLGVRLNDAAHAIGQFMGVKRRFEIRGSINGCPIVDDYGHHPTAIAATIKAARQVFEGRRIVLAFEPHQLSRTESLFSEFVSSCGLADEILLLPVFPARENATHLECCRMSGKLVKQLNKRNNKAFLFANLDQIVSRIDHSARPSDVCITMGAGTTNLIYDHLTRRLQRHSVA